MLLIHHRWLPLKRRYYAWDGWYPEFNPHARGSSHDRYVPRKKKSNQDSGFREGVSLDTCSATGGLEGRHALLIGFQEARIWHPHTFSLEDIWRTSCEKIQDINQLRQWSISYVEPGDRNRSTTDWMWAVAVTQTIHVQSNLSNPNFKEMKIFRTVRVLKSRGSND